MGFIQESIKNFTRNNSFKRREITIWFTDFTASISLKMRNATKNSIQMINSSTKAVDVVFFIF